MPLILALLRQRQEDLWEFKVSLVYRVPGQLGLQGDLASKTTTKTTNKQTNKQKTRFC